MLKNTFYYSARTNMGPEMCISDVLLKHLSYDQIHQIRMDAIMFDNDAHTCYNRIIVSLATIMSPCSGMPRDAAHVLIRLLLLKI
jgi:hypothetical protein